MYDKATEGQGRALGQDYSKHEQWRPVKSHINVLSYRGGILRFKVVDTEHWGA